VCVSMECSARASPQNSLKEMTGDPRTRLAPDLPLHGKVQQEFEYIRHRNTKREVPISMLLGGSHFVRRRYKTEVDFAHVRVLGEVNQLPKKVGFDYQLHSIRINRIFSHCVAQSVVDLGIKGESGIQIDQDTVAFFRSVEPSLSFTHPKHSSWRCSKLKFGFSILVRKLLLH